MGMSLVSCFFWDTVYMAWWKRNEGRSEFYKQTATIPDISRNSSVKMEIVFDAICQ